MEAGKLDRRLTLRPAAYTTNAFNERVGVWADTVTIWASKSDVSDAERVQAQQVGATISTRFRVRYSTVTAALIPEDRVYCDGKEYDIHGLKEIGRREGVEITATARVTVGVVA